MKTNAIKLISTSAVMGVLLLGCSMQPAAKSPGSAQAEDAAPPSGAPVELKVQWPAGRRCTFHMEMVQVSDANDSDAARPVKQTVNLAQDLAVTSLTDLPDGGRELELEFVAQKLEVRAGEHTELSFDSAEDPSRDALNSVAAMFRRMTGGRVRFEVDAGGEVVNLKGYEDLAARVAGKDPKTEHIFRKIFNEDLLKKYCSFSDGLPDHSVKPGDAWRKQRDMLSPAGIMPWNTRTTFTGWEQHADHKCCRLDYTGELVSDRTASGEKRDVIKGNMSGTSWFDPGLGVEVEVVADRHVTMKDSDAKSGVAENSQKITMTLSGVEDTKK